MSSDGVAGILLREHLTLTVPMALADLAAGGGPHEHDWAMARVFAADLAAHGDVLQFGGKAGQAADLVSRLARSLAVLAYAPGGVTFLGLHWEQSR